MTVWKAAADRNRVHAQTADKALVFFAQRTAFKCWKVALGRKRRDEWVGARKKEVLMEMFGRKSAQS
jgi:phytoene/squalene synthetase